ncbi:MAG: DUF4419 domain-containing protein [Bacteroidaceae bacterium]|nr:DUF4419 domain-containing protein [Bacteroidaceae bacterium]
MKKLVLACVLALLFGTGVIGAKKIKNASLEDIVTVAPGAVTFKVEDVEIADDLLPEKNGENLGRKWAEGKPYLGSSFADKSLVDGDDNAFFSMVCLAYAQHRPIVLSPDIMWIIICNGYSQYVNRDPESFRQYLVGHEGKETLLIKTTPETTAAQKVEKFAELIAKETKGDVAELITCNFSTTGMIERMVSQITLMETVKQYFDYLNLVSGCGIPSITLEGTPDDWRLLREKTRKLGEFGVKSWTDKLDPILAEFVSASKGNPNLKFWWNMAIKGRPYDFHLKAGGGCLPKYGPTPFNGWFLEFIPFDTRGERPSAIPYGHKLPPLMTSVPIIQYFEDDMGNCIGINSLDLRGGIVGLAQDTATMALRPEIGWLVRNDPTVEFDEDDVRLKVQQAKEMGDDDAVIKQGIKKPENRQDDSHLGKRPDYSHYGFVDPEVRKPLYLAEFEGWGIELECRVW